MSRKKTRNNNKDHPLANELVARGHVPEDRRDALAAYLAARERFLGRFGRAGSAVQDSLENLRRRAEALGEAARQAAREVERYRQMMEKDVLPDVRLILKKGSELDRIDEAAEELWAFGAPPDAGRVAHEAGRQADAHACLSKLLAQVKEQLDGTGPAGSGRRG